MERIGVVTFKGAPLTLIGAEVKTGDKAPAFTVIDRDLREVGYKDLGRVPKLISVTPSLDTPVCDAQARRFNVEAAKLPAEFQIMNISMDLPFAIGRFCATSGIDRIKTYSDYRHAYFGMAYGVMIKELRLLARSVFVIDSHDVIRYMEIAPEETKGVDFDAALDAALRLVSAAGRM
ncbi:MAG: thiol peroxidase [Deltaproteobacteria bacterium]|nr:thiol peroxidase [Deltaproteobacteria bacterium]